MNSGFSTVLADHRRLRNARLKTMENVVRVFDSFEDADAADREERARMTPEQRVEIFFQLRERAHPDAFTQGFTRVYRVLELEQS